MLKISVPGKLYLLGEYNVMAPSHSAIVFAVNKTIDVTIKDSLKFVLINQEEEYHFEFDNERLLMSFDHLDYTKSALEVSFEYLRTNGITPKVFSIKIINNLVNKHGIKYGLGSSASLMVAIIKAILYFHNQKITDSKLFKLTVLAQFKSKKFSSGGDIAASCFTGLLFYKRYDYMFVKQNLDKGMQVVEMPWPGLEIIPLPAKGLNLQIGWTGNAHYTKTKDSKDIINDPDFIEFSKTAELYVNAAKEALINNNYDIGHLINDYQTLLNQLDDKLQIGFNTPILKTLIYESNKLNYAAKISGAGFGDCGFALANNDPELTKMWAKHGIINLDINIYWQKKDTLNEY